MRKKYKPKSIRISMDIYYFIWGFKLKKKTSVNKAVISILDTCLIELKHTIYPQNLMDKYAAISPKCALDIQTTWRLPLELIERFKEQDIAATLCGKIKKMLSHYISESPVKTEFIELGKKFK
ncbi:hypothetical protein AGMMS49573_07850 [Endomicrobiia bacterium]|nr:hypothetical protein AGMMS49573_07850 [Endomicrobiia bacterium]